MDHIQALKNSIDRLERLQSVEFDSADENTQLDLLLSKMPTEAIQLLNQNESLIVPYMEQVTYRETIDMVLSSIEAAACLDVSKEFLNKMSYIVGEHLHQSGKVPCIKKGKVLLYSPQALKVWNHYRPKRGTTNLTIPEHYRELDVLKDQLKRLKSKDFSTVLAEVIAGDDGSISFLVDMLLDAPEEILLNVLQANNKILIEYMETVTLLEPVQSAITKQEVADKLKVTETLIQNRKYDIQDDTLTFQDKTKKVPCVHKGKVLLFSPQAVHVWNRIREKRGLPAETFIRNDYK